MAAISLPLAPVTTPGLRSMCRCLRAILCFAVTLAGRRWRRWLGWWLLAGAAPAFGHDVLQGWATARIYSDRLEVDLTVARAVAFYTVGVDPFKPLDGSPDGSDLGAPDAIEYDQAGRPIERDAMFDKIHPQLVESAANLYSVASAGVALQPRAVTVELTDTRDVEYHLTYPRPGPGPLSFVVRYLDKAPAGHVDTFSVYDRAGQNLGYADLSVDNPALEVTVPAAPAPPAPPPPTGWLDDSGSRRFSYTGVGAFAIAALLVTWGAVRLSRR